MKSCHEGDTGLINEAQLQTKDKSPVLHGKCSLVKEIDWVRDINKQTYQKLIIFS